jgi:hypothetical protein
MGPRSGPRYEHESEWDPESELEPEPGSLRLRLVA